jgi:Flagellar C1a complex subunit C1a-32
MLDMRIHLHIHHMQDAAAITEYTVNSYFRHYHLYKHLYTLKVTTILVQRNLHGTEEPFSVPPLADAVPVELDDTASDSIVDTTTAAVAAASIEA